jgi:hypothetical protein
MLRIPRSLFARTALLLPILLPASAAPWLEAAPAISQIQAPAQVARHAKFEVTFQVGSTVARNLQWPYDPAPPAGISPGAGIDVDILLSPDNWQTVFVQPAFYFQAFTDEVRNDKPWNYPTGVFAWKGRFSPPKAGTWQFKIRARDAGGATETAAKSFSVVDSPNPGFVRVSAKDRRYFEFENGNRFVGLGYNASRLKEADFQTMQKNGIQLIRTWWTGPSVFGSQWNPYFELRNQYNGYVPRAGVLAFTDDLTGKASIKMRIDYEPEGNTGWFDGCRVIGQWGTPTEVKPNARYLLRVTYRGFNLTGPRNAASSQFGFVVKTGVNWTQRDQCFEPGTGTRVTGYGGNTPSSWGTIQGYWNSGTANFLPPFYLLLENVSNGQVYVDTVSMREDLGGGQYGPEVMHKPSMEHQLYFQQHASFQIDQIVSWAEKYGVYLKPVILEKGEKIMRKIGLDGNFSPDADSNFYGDYRNVTHVRWLQQSWWRYLQARWGYSPSIHSWELCNEGDPVSTRHYALADEMGKFMRGRVFGVPVAAGDGVNCTYQHPNRHMVSTSFWHSLPSKAFWANTRYPNVDYADVHAYISTGWLKNAAHETDAALYHLDYSADCRSNLDYFSGLSGIPTKPIVRGEGGIDFVNKQSENPDLAKDSQGIWLHNLVWAGLAPGALHEFYWWTDNREKQPGPDGLPGLHEIYRPHFYFAHDVPLNNGQYRDLAASVSNSGLRVVGQKDLTAGKAHAWIQNKQHTWRNVVDQVKVSPISGSVTIQGFAPNAGYEVQWWDPYQIAATPGPFKIEVLTASASGAISVPVTSLATDLAFKLSLKSAVPAAPRDLRILKIE